MPRTAAGVLCYHLVRPVVCSNDVCPSWTLEMFFVPALQQV